MREGRYVNSRIVCVRRKIKRECWPKISVYGSGRARSREEGERFWVDFMWCIGSWKEKERAVASDDMNPRVGIERGKF